MFLSCLISPHLYLFSNLFIYINLNKKLLYVSLMFKASSVGIVMKKNIHIFLFFFFEVDIIYSYIKEQMFSLLFKVVSLVSP